MYNSITVFFDVNEGACILLVILGKRCGDCDGWGIGETKT